MDRVAHDHSTLDLLAILTGVSTATGTFKILVIDPFHKSIDQNFGLVFPKVYRIFSQWVTELVHYINNRFVFLFN